MSRRPMLNAAASALISLTAATAAAAPEATAAPGVAPHAVAASRIAPDPRRADAARWRVGERPAPGAWRAIRHPARYGVADPPPGWTLAVLGEDIVTLDGDGVIRGLAAGL